MQAGDSGAYARIQGPERAGREYSTIGNIGFVGDGPLPLTDCFATATPSTRPWAARHYALAAQGLSRLSQIRALIVITSILATIAVMGAMLWQRRDHIARLKSLGYSRRILRHSLAIECAAILGIGCFLGGLAGIYGEVLNSHALAIVTGFPVFFHTATLLAVTSFAIFAAVGLAIVSVAGYLVVRVPTRTTSSAY